MSNKLMDATAESQSLLESQPETGESRLNSPVATSAGNLIFIPKCFITFVAIMVLGGILVGVSSLFGVSPIVEPELYIGNFHIPSLDVASKDPGIINTATITFDLSFENLNPKQLQILYDTVDVNLYYYGSSSSLSLPIGNTSIPEFDQGNTWPTLRVETIKTYGVPWEDARMEILNWHRALFRVDLHTKYRSSNQLWFAKSQRYDLRIGANVTVNDHGLKSVKQRLKLR